VLYERRLAVEMVRLRHVHTTQRALSVTQRALSVTQRALSVTQRALSVTQRALSVTQRALSVTQRALSVTQRALSVTQRAHLSVWFPSPRPPLRRDGDWWVVHAPPLLLRMRASMLGRVLAWLQDFEQAM
jgi:hypothetical protein